MKVPSRLPFFPTLPEQAAKPLPSFWGCFPSCPIHLQGYPYVKQRDAHAIETGW